MTHPRSACGGAPSGYALSPSRGRHQRPGEAGSAVVRDSVVGDEVSLAEQYLV